MQIASIVCVFFSVFPNIAWASDFPELKTICITKTYMEALKNQFHKTKKLTDIEKVEKIKEYWKKNIVVYQNYAAHMLLEDTKTDSCNCCNDDPLVKLINLFSGVNYSGESFDKISKIMLEEKYGSLAVWSLDDIFYGNDVISQKWTAKYGLSPADSLIDKLYNSITISTPNAIKFLLYLYKESDGEYSEILSDKILEIFLKKNEIVFNYFYLFDSMHDDMKVIFCGWSSNEDRQKLKNLHKKYLPNRKSQKILKWLSCQENEGVRP
jgi:hypothetical protein